MKYLSFVFLSLFLISCGSKDRQTINQLFSACAKEEYKTNHVVNIQNLSNIPNNIAIELEGKIEYDECSDESFFPPPPAVTLQQQNSALYIKVTHYRAYDQLPGNLPSDVSLKVIDRGDCSTTTDYYTVNKAPLNFTTEYPNGTHCRGETKASITVN